MSTRQDVEETGEWLGEELLGLGCEEGLMLNICQALGQRLAMLPGGVHGEVGWVDMQAEAERVLARYRRGDWDEPGEALANRLCSEYWGSPPDKARVREWLARLLKTIAEEGV